MLRSYALPRRALALTAALGLLLASAVPALFGNPSASAAQLTERSITLGTTVISEATTYDVSFNVGSATNIQGIVVDFCTNSPLVGQPCTAPNGIVTQDAVDTVGVTNADDPETITFDVDAASTANGTVILTNASGFTAVPAVGETITFSLDVTNPSDLGTFYARIITTSTTAAAVAYDPNDGSGTTGYIDNGGIALSTARQLTVNARVQEQLEFCVAAIDSTILVDADMPVDCSALGTDTEVNLGVIDNTAPIAGTKGISPVPATNGGNDKNGGVMVRTNAVGGAVLSYRAEQETLSGALKVPGASCNGTNTDQCFNSAGTPHDFSASGESFGMAVSATLRNPLGDTNVLEPTPDYDNADALGNLYTWDTSGTAVEFANTAGTVADYELAVIRFAARAAATTPTGAYTVTSTYIATATF